LTTHPAGEKSMVFSTRFLPAGLNEVLGAHGQC
jgi:hypothetical protein